MARQGWARQGMARPGEAGFLERSKMTTLTFKGNDGTVEFIGLRGFEVRQELLPKFGDYSYWCAYRRFDGDGKEKESVELYLHEVRLVSPNYYLFNAELLCFDGIRVYRTLERGRGLSRDEAILDAFHKLAHSLIKGAVNG